MDENQKRILRERAMTRALLAGLKRAGWLAWRTWDGEEWGKPVDDDNVVALAFNLDEVSVRFAPAALVEEVRALRIARKAGQGDSARLGVLARQCERAEHGVLLVLGNDGDLISDWSYSEGDADGFNAAMDKLARRLWEAPTLHSYLRQCDRIAVAAGSWLKGAPLPVIFMGEDGPRKVGECGQIGDVDALLIAQHLSAGRISHAVVDDFPNAWRKEVYIAHA